MKKIAVLFCAVLMHTSWATEFKVCDDANTFEELNGSLCASVKTPQAYNTKNNKS